MLSTLAAARRQTGTRRGSNDAAERLSDNASPRLIPIAGSTRRLRAKSRFISKARRRSILAGELGFEPRQTESESVVLPLHHSPMISYQNQSVSRRAAIPSKSRSPDGRSSPLRASRASLVCSGVTSTINLFGTGCLERQQGRRVSPPQFPVDHTLAGTRNYTDLNINQYIAPSAYR